MSPNLDRPAERRWRGLLEGFFGRLALRVLERAVNGFGVFINSVLIARTLDNHDAAAYFLVAAVCQLVISPWIASADYVFIGLQTRKVPAEEAVRQVFRPVLWGSVVSALVSLAICAPFVSGVGSWLILLGCALGNCVFALAALQFASKFGQPGRYLFVSLLGGGLAILVKLAALLYGHHGLWTYVALFSDYFLVAALALLCRPVGSLLAPTPSLRALFAAFGAPAFLVVSSVFSQRFVMLVTSHVLPQEDYVTFGLSYQVLNLVSVFSVAISHSVAAASLNTRNPLSGLLQATRRGMLAVTVIFAGFWLFMALFGRPTLAWLLQGRGAGVYEIVMFGLPYSASLLLLGLCHALASVTGAVRKYAWVLAATSAIGVAVLCLAPVDTLGSRVMWWGLTTQACGLLVLAWLIWRAQVVLRASRRARRENRARRRQRRQAREGRVVADNPACG